MEMVVVVGITDSSRSPVSECNILSINPPALCMQTHYSSMISNIIPGIYCKKESENNEE
jgi:hypothetical protein